MKNGKLKSKQTTASNKDYWGTPPEVMDFVRDELHLEPLLDVCATADNKCAEYFIGEDSDALKCSWFAELAKHTGEQMGYADMFCAWMNPPFSRKEEFYHYAASEAKTGLIIASIAPYEPVTKWWRETIHKNAVACYVPQKRVAYIHPDTKHRMTGPNFGSSVVLFAPWGGLTECQYIFIEELRGKSNEQ